MYKENSSLKASQKSDSDPRQDLIDLATAIIPGSVRLQTIHPNRERSISALIDDPKRHPLERLGHAAERTLTSLLSSHVTMDSRRLLVWSTRHQQQHTIELDGIAEQLVLLEYKISVRPEGVAKECRRQLLQAGEVIRQGAKGMPFRAVGVVVDCGPLVGLPPAQQLSSVEEVVNSIKLGGCGYSLRIVSYDEVADFFKESQYGMLLSPQSLRSIYLARTRSEQAG